MLEITVQRETLTNLSTLGKMTAIRCDDDGENEVKIDEIDFYTLEDTKREHKVHGQTRIPSGYYKVAVHDWGKAVRYNKNYADINHRGMLALEEVPGFTGILLHPGNNKDDTEGCILMGRAKNANWIGRSGEAYRILYPIVIAALEAGEEVWVKVRDEDQTED